MDLFLNILLIVFVSTLVCIIYDFFKSYLLTKKLKKLSNGSGDNSWNEFWNNINLNTNDFTDKEE